MKTRPVLAAADVRILLEAARGEAERLVGAAAVQALARLAKA